MSDLLKPTDWKVGDRVQSPRGPGSVIYVQDTTNGVQAVGISLDQPEQPTLLAIGGELEPLDP